MFVCLARSTKYVVRTGNRGKSAAANGASGGGGARDVTPDASTPTQPTTNALLIKPPPELRCGNFASLLLIGAKRGKKKRFQPSFRFARHRCRLGTWHRTPTRTSLSQRLSHSSSVFTSSRTEYSPFFLDMSRFPDLSFFFFKLKKKMLYCERLPFRTTFLEIVILLFFFLLFFFFFKSKRKAPLQGGTYK